MPEPMQLRRRVGPALTATTPTIGPGTANLKIGELLYDGYDDSLYIGYGTNPGNLIDATAIHPVVGSGRLVRVNQQIDRTLALPPPAITGAAISVNGADGAASAIELDGFGGIAHFGGRRANGSMASLATPTAANRLITNDIIVDIVGRGHDGAVFAPVSGRVAIAASGDWDATHHATSIRFETTLPDVGASIAPVAAFINGSLVLGNPLPAAPAAGNIYLVGDIIPGTVLTTAATTVGGAINELRGDIDAIAAGIQVVGDYNPLTDEVAPHVGAPAGVVAGRLPTAAAANEGWIFIVSQAGTVPTSPPLALPQSPLAGTAMLPGNWVASNGAAWRYQNIGLGAAVIAGNVGLTAIAGTGITAATVQLAFEQVVPLGGTTAARPITGPLHIGTTAVPADVYANGFEAVNPEAFFEWEVEGDAASSFSWWANGTGLNAVARLSAAGTAGGGPLGIDQPRLSVAANGALATANAGVPTTAGSINIPTGAEYQINGTALTMTVSVTGPALTGNGLAGTPITIAGLDGGTWG